MHGSIYVIPAYFPIIIANMSIHVPRSQNAITYSCAKQRQKQNLCFTKQLINRYILYFSHVDQSIGVSWVGGKTKRPIDWSIHMYIYVRCRSRENLAMHL